MHFSKCVDSSDDQRRNNLEISLVERGWVVERGSVARVDSRSRARRVGAWQSRVNGTISSTARAIISSTMRPFRRPERVSWHLRSVLDSILVRQSMFSLLSTFVSKRSSSRTIGPESRKISIIRLANTIAISLFYLSYMVLRTLELPKIVNICSRETKRFRGLRSISYFIPTGWWLIRRYQKLYIFLRLTSTLTYFY